MLTTNFTSLLLLLLLPLYATTSAVAFDNALALIESQSDLTLIAALIRRDPELVKLFSTVKNATIVAAIDSGFTTIDPNNIIYSNRAPVRAVLQDTVIRGLHPTSAITKDPIYPSTFLSNPRFVDTSRGRAASKLVEVDGKKTVDIGSGTRANIIQGDLRFKGGIVHKVSNPLDSPASFFSTGSRLNITAIRQLSGGFTTIFEAVTGARDTTLFTITNEASEALAGTQPDATLEKFIDALGYFVVTPGVYFEDAFTGKSVQAFNGAGLKLAGFGTGTTMVNDAVVVRSDIFATNGVLHILDRPLNPMPNQDTPETRITGTMIPILWKSHSVDAAPSLSKLDLGTLDHLNASGLNIPTEFKVDITVDESVPLDPEEIYRIAVEMMYEVSEFPLTHAWYDRDWSSPDGSMGIFMEHKAFSRKDPSELYTRFVMWGLYHMMLSITLSRRFCQTIAILKWRGVPVGAIYVAKKTFLRPDWKSGEQNGVPLQLARHQDEGPFNNSEDIDIVASWTRGMPIPRELIYLTTIKAIGEAAERGLDQPVPTLLTTSIQRVSWNLHGGVTFPGILRPRHSRIAALKIVAKMQEDDRFQTVQVWISVDGLNTAAGGFTQRAMTLS